MKVAIRPAHLEHDRRVIIETVARYLNPRSDEARYEWMYVKNPNGPARVWLAEEVSGNRIVGMASAFPRGMVCGGQDLLGWVLGEFCVAEEHRALGPALQLQRAIVAGVDSGMADLFYDFPSRAMMAVYRRLGIDTAGDVIRFVKLLRSEGWVERAIPTPWLAHPLSRVGNVALAFRDRLQAADQSISIDEVVEAEVGEEFAQLWSRAESRFGLCVRRSTRYLSWRYRQTPVAPLSMVAARRKGKLLGYAVVAQEAKSATLMDCVAGQDSGAVAAMVQTLAMKLRAQGVETLSVSTSGGTWWADQLTSLGFVPRESSPFVTYLSAKTRAQIGQRGSWPWVVMQGDRDC
jgi:hypothetical protein